MTPEKRVDDRLSALEAELSTLKQLLPNDSQENSWIDRVTGSFRNQPEFDEVVRLGRELRRSEKDDPA